jgi:hypothetical protein
MTSDWKQPKSSGRKSLNILTVPPLFNFLYQTREVIEYYKLESL